MKAVLTVVGKDAVGILAKVSAGCAEHGVNIMEVSQSVLSDMFCMIMICDISGLSGEFGTFSEDMKVLGEQMGMSIHVMHEDIFNSMHNI